MSQIQLVVFDISLSLDGYMRGPDPDAQRVLGKGGEHLHAWVGPGATEADRKLLSDSIQSAGAVVCGRRTYDDSLPSWGVNGPTGPARLPVIVVSHSTGQPPEGGVYQFQHSIAAPLAAARFAAHGKHVCVMGGADVGRQYLAAGLIDELSLHIAPVLLGGGTRMFGDGTPASHPFAIKSVVHSPCATHLRYTIRS